MVDLRNYVIIRPNEEARKDSRVLLSNVIFTSMGARAKPEQRVDNVTVVGRDGALYIRQGYSDITKTLQIGLLPHAKIDEIIDFFNDEGEILFSDDPEYIYVYMQNAEIDFEQLYRYRTADVNMIVRPYKFPIMGNAHIYQGTAQDMQIHNKGNYYSQPLISWENTYNESTTYELYVSETQGGTQGGHLTIEVQTAGYILFDTQSCVIYFEDTNGRRIINSTSYIEALSPFWMPRFGDRFYTLYCKPNSGTRNPYIGIVTYNNIARFLA